MHFVYICRDGNNEELRYSIRSVVASFPDAQIWVVGGRPGWYNGNFIRVKATKQKFENAINNLKTIVESDEIPENFVLMNDDFFIVKPLTEIRDYNGGTLKEKLERYRSFAPKSLYSDMIESTINYLATLGFDDPIDYDLHIPINVNKASFGPVLDRRSLYRSVYGNLSNLGGDFMNDVKVYPLGSEETHSYDYKNGDSPYLSSHDVSFNRLRIEVLDDLFPDPSPYEI